MVELPKRTPETVLRRLNSQDDALLFEPPHQGGPEQGQRQEALGRRRRGSVTKRSAANHCCFWSEVRQRSTLATRCATRLSGDSKQRGSCFRTNVPWALLGSSITTTVVEWEILHGRTPGATRHDFATIGSLTLMPTVLSVPADSPWKSVADAESEDNIKILRQLQKEGVKLGR